MRFDASNTDVLHQNGFKYDSSLYGGLPETVSSATAKILELPVSCSPAHTRTHPPSFGSALLKGIVPFGSGVIVAALPAVFISAMIRKLNAAGMPCVLFIHQWQMVRPSKLISLLLGLKRSMGGKLTGLKLRDIYSLLSVPTGRLRKLLLGNHSFTTMDRLANEYEHTTGNGN